MNRLRDLREERNQNMRQTAIELGIPYTTYISYEKGEREPNSEMLIKLADYFDCSIDYLIGNSKNKALIKTVSTVPYSPQDMVPIPVIGRVAAGYTCLAETDIECYELVDSEVLNSGYEYVYLKVVGDSMEPLILEGDLVLVRLQEIVESGDYAVVIVDEEDGVVKQIEFDNDCIKLISQNPYYPPRIFKGKSRERVRIYGKVVESKRKFN